MSIRPVFAKVIAVFAIIVMAASTVNAAGTSPVLERIEKSKTLRVGMTGTQPPKS